MLIRHNVTYTPNTVMQIQANLNKITHRGTAGDLMRKTEFFSRVEFYQQALEHA